MAEIKSVEVKADNGEVLIEYAGEKPDIKRLNEIFKKELDEFRDLSWVGEPCKSCDLLHECVGGCKVDSNCPGEFCIDCAVRGCKKPVNKIKIKIEEPKFEIPKNMRRFKKNKYFE